MNFTSMYLHIYLSSGNCVNPRWEAYDRLMMGLVRISHLLAARKEMHRTLSDGGEIWFLFGVQVSVVNLKQR